MGIKDRLRKLERDNPPPACKEQPCKQPVRMLEAVRITAEACLNPIPKGIKLEGFPKQFYWIEGLPPEYKRERFTIENYPLVTKGSYPPPLCEGCPHRNDPKQPIRSLTVIKSYVVDDVA